MSVYTTLTHAEIAQFLDHYSIGELVDFSPIQAGIENTNYFITTKNQDEQRKWVLTLVEFHDNKTTAFAAELSYFLQAQGLKVAAPIKRKDGLLFADFKNKPCTIIPCLPGSHLAETSLSSCAQIGEFLGQFHAATIATELSFDRRDRDAWPEQWQDIQEELSESQNTLVHAVLDEFQQLTGQNLKQSAIHGDLFIDNVLFHEGQLSGVIDFYHATIDYCLYDLAVAADDWCRNETGLDLDKLEAMLSAYQAQRPFTEDEKTAWPVFLKAAALHFWFSRILTIRWQRKQGAKGVSTKNPAERYELLLWLEGQTTALAG
ncbi:MAG: homoserine kinase [Pseudomonadota bacterium]|nr:homoserine kinase [Pseudomonadota bacterium]